ncbi:AMP-binding protein [Litorivivens sp.]|uniref:AMP-binding protein n=1 Tax=Litorivivens sp. TaxID=2020868 RepID=UPI00356AF487
MAMPDYSVNDNRVLGNILAYFAQQRPSTDFLVADDRRITYAEAYTTAQRLAAGLQAQGLSAGDRLCLYLSSSPDFVLLALAANLAGIHWIPVNTDYRGQWLAETLKDSAPSLVVTDTAFQSRLAEVSVAAPVIVLGATCEELLSDADFKAPSIAYGDTASIMWTSGTTGKSKGVMQSHNAWVRSALSAAEMGGVDRGDVAYNCLPLYNSAAWVTGIYPALVTGTTCAMDPAFSATTFWERTRFYQATHVFTLGAMHMFLWNAPPQASDADNPVRSAQMVPMPDAIREPFKQRFGINAIHQGFGQSEIMLLMRRYDDGVTPWPPNSLGTPADDIEVALFNDSDEPVAVGEPGEICVREKSPHVLFNGYFNNPQATEQAFHGGWYHTGDLLKQDEAGHFYFVDRKKDLIRYKGRSVSSVAIESVARSHPGISDVAVYGVASAELESEHEIMLAAIPVPGAEVSEAELARHINDNAPYFFVPRYIEFVEQLPMTPTQKVQKNKLRERGLTEHTWDAKAADFEVQR